MRLQRIFMNTGAVRRPRQRFFSNRSGVPCAAEINIFGAAVHDRSKEQAFFFATTKAGAMRVPRL
jgi:hypothetical protein